MELGMAYLDIWDIISDRGFCEGVESGELYGNPGPGREAETMGPCSMFPRGVEEFRFMGCLP